METVCGLNGPTECIPCQYVDYSGGLLEHFTSTEHMKMVNGGVRILLAEKRSQIKCQQCSKVI